MHISTGSHPHGSTTCTMQIHSHSLIMRAFHEQSPSTSTEMAAPQPLLYQETNNAACKFANCNRVRPYELLGPNRHGKIITYVDDLSFNNQVFANFNCKLDTIIQPNYLHYDQRKNKNKRIQVAWPPHTQC